MINVDFFYQSGAYKSRYADFPIFPFVTKTFTLERKFGFPFAVLPIGKSVWNHVSLSNKGFNWVINNPRIFHPVTHPSFIISVHGTDDEISQMVELLNMFGEYFYQNLNGIELNFSCPNVKDKKNKDIPYSKIPLYLKLNCKQDPNNYDISKIVRIHVNSVPIVFGGLSGRMAQKYNWPWIEKYIKQGFHIAGSSITSHRDIKSLANIGCKAIGIGSIVLTDKQFVKSLGKYK